MSKVLVQGVREAKAASMRESDTGAMPRASATIVAGSARAAHLAAPARAAREQAGPARDERRAAHAPATRPHRSVRERGGQSETGRELAPPLRAHSARAIAVLQAGVGRSARGRAGSSRCAHSSQADCSAMLMPSPMIGCASPAALPMRNRPSVPCAGADPDRAARRRASGRRAGARRARRARRGIRASAGPRPRRRRARRAALAPAGVEAVAPDAGGERRHAAIGDDHAAVAAVERQHRQQARGQRARRGSSP